MSHGRRNVQRLITLWRRNCLCHWCKRATVLVVVPAGTTGQHLHATQFNERATIDHLHSRLSGRRKQRNDGVEQTVLACYKCNQRRCREEQAALPIEELNRRSGRFATKAAAQAAEER